MTVDDEVVVKTAVDIDHQRPLFDSLVDTVVVAEGHEIYH